MRTISYGHLRPSLWSCPRLTTLPCPLCVSSLVLPQARVLIRSRCLAHSMHDLLTTGTPPLSPSPSLVTVATTPGPQRSSTYVVNVHGRTSAEKRPRAFRRHALTEHPPHRSCYSTPSTAPGTFSACHTQLLDALLCADSADSANLDHDSLALALPAAACSASINPSLPHG